MKTVVWMWVAVTVAACGGIGIPKQQPGESYPGDRHEVTATIRQTMDGCLRLEVDGGETYPVVWPASASQGNDDWVSLGWFQPDLGVGDRVRGSAVLVAAASLPGWNSEYPGYWTDAIGQCVERGDGTQSPVLIFDTAEGVDP